MTEDILQLVWQHRLYSEPLFTNDGEKIEVINTGLLNKDAGPDFTNATIKVNGISLTGNVEVHSRASDWFIHRHDNDDRYNNVILHVVEVDDKEVPQATYQSALCLTEHSVRVAHELAVYPNSIRCFKYWEKDREKLTDILESQIPEMLEERLVFRASEILEYKKLWQCSIDEVLYFRLVRTLGVNVNQEAFERLARTVTLKILNSGFFRVTDIEAMLFGAAGFIPNESKDNYVTLLQTLYDKYNAQYSLPAMDRKMWIMGRFRPVARPEIRIAQFASFLESNKKYLSAKLLSGRSVKDISQMLSCDVSDYWKTHFAFDSKEGKSESKKMGDEFRKSMIINAIAPVIYAQGMETGNESQKAKARELIHSIKFETNHLTGDWKELVSPSLKLKGADISQALIHLRKEYCDKKECLRCKICHYLLRY